MKCCSFSIVSDLKRFKFAANSCDGVVICGQGHKSCEQVKAWFSFVPLRGLQFYRGVWVDVPFLGSIYDESSERLSSLGSFFEPNPPRVRFWGVRDFACAGAVGHVEAVWDGRRAILLWVAATACCKPQYPHSDNTMWSHCHVLENLWRILAHLCLSH